MITDRIKYGRSFQVGLSIWERIDMEATIEQGDDLEKCFSELKNQVETTHKKLNPHLYPKGNEAIIESFGDVPQVQVSPKENAINSQIEAISGCSSLKSLEIFKKLVDRTNDERLTSAYNKKLNELRYGI